MKLTEIAINKGDTIEINASIKEVFSKFKEIQTRYLCVVEGLKPIGLIFQKDILEAMINDTSEDLAISKLIKKDIPTIKNLENIEVAHGMVDKFNLTYLILINNMGEYEGILKRDTIIFYMDLPKKYKKNLITKKPIFMENISDAKAMLGILQHSEAKTILIGDEKELKGVITNSTFINYLDFYEDLKIKLDTTLLIKPTIVESDISTKEALHVMIKNNIDSLVVYDNDGYFIVKRDDLLKKEKKNNYIIKNDTENSYKDVFSQNVIGVIYVSKELKIITENRYIDELFGYNEGELNNKNLKTIMHPSTLDKVYKRYESIKSSKKSQSFIQRYITKENKEVKGLVILSAILDDNDDIKYYLAFIQDYEKHYDNFQEIKRENDVLETILDSVEDVIFFKDKDLRYQMVNKHFLLHTNHSKDEVIGKKDEDLFPYSMAKKHIQSNQRIIKNRSSDSYITLWHSNKRETQTEWKITLKTVFNRNDKFVGIVGNAHDLEIDKKLEDRQRLIQNVFEFSAEGMVITDKNEKITAVNQAFTDITGYTQDDLLGLKPNILSSGKHDKEFYKNMWSELNEKGSWRGEVINRKKTGEEYPELLTISVIKNDMGEIVNYTGIFSDITKLKETQLELEYIAHHDSLTGLQNRLSLELNIKQMVDRAKRGKYMFGILFFDLDHFKEINDTYGHSTGDKILIQVATRLRRLLRDTDIISRLGGDEFIVLVENFVNMDNFMDVIDKIFNIFKYPFIVGDKIFNTTCSIGASVYPNDGDDMETLVKNADVAMYQAKKAGRNTYCLYADEMTNALLRKVEAVADIRRGVANGEFFLQYQPQIDIRTNTIIGTEALVRWQHPVKGLLPPNDFIPLAEENQLIISIGKQVLEKACKDIKEWLDKGINLKDFRVAVNVSAVQLLNDDLYKTVKDVTEKVGISPKYLEIELTETSIMNDPDRAMKLFEKFKNLSVTLSIDDFGTGYSSLSYLKKFSIHKIKIDRSFINDIPFDKDDIAITKAILALGKSMDLEVVAEGVEEVEQKSFLLKEGCNRAQGYFYAKPLYAEELEEKFLKSR